MNNSNREKIRKEFQRKANQVSAIFQKNPSNIREEMEKLGFMWVDDGVDEMNGMKKKTLCQRTTMSGAFLNI